MDTSGPQLHEKPAEQPSGSKHPAPSVASSLTVPGIVSPGHGESAIPADKEEEEMENIVDDWEDDPDNARNWPGSKKWIMVGIVSLPHLLNVFEDANFVPRLHFIPLFHL